MSNQLLLWAIIIIPWIIVLFLNKEELKKFMPAGLLAVILSIIILEVGETLEWWVTKETAYPLKTVANVFGLNPVIAILLLRFTYGRFWLYLLADIVTNVIFSYLYCGYLNSRGIFYFMKAGPFEVFLITMVIGLLIYWYQKWQEGVFIKRYRYL